jgi:hypothetical protein
VSPTELEFRLGFNKNHRWRAGGIQALLKALLPRGAFKSVGYEPESRIAVRPFGLRPESVPVQANRVALEYRAQHAIPAEDIGVWRDRTKVGWVTILTAAGPASDPQRGVARTSARHPDNEMIRIPNLEYLPAVFGPLAARKL